MLRLTILTIALVALVGCDRSPQQPAQQPQQPTQRQQPAPPPTTTSAWEIGPVIGGISYSPGMPRTLDSGDSFAFPVCGGPSGPQGRGRSVNYVTQATGPIDGSITLDFTIEASDDAVLVPTEGSDPRVRLYFQRRGDDWSGEGAMSGYRWFSRRTDGVSLTPGRHSLTVPLNYERWGGATTRPTAEEFEAAKRNAAVVGFTFGGNQAAGHGVCLERGWARFVLNGFRVQ